MIDSGKRCTIYKSNTPLYNPEIDEVEVVDPTHPLFGRKFPIASITRHQKGSGSVHVHYRKFMLLCIPIQVTTLAVQVVSYTRTKLNFSAVEELLAIAEDCNILCLENKKHTEKNFTTLVEASSKFSNHSSEGNR